MTIAVSPDHLALAESVRGLTGRTIDQEAQHKLLDSSELPRPDYWAAAAESGFFGLHIPEKLGGQGFGYLEQAVVVEELGRAVAAGYYVPTVIAAAVVAEAGYDEARLEVQQQLADGGLQAGFALNSALTGEPDGAGLRVTGSAGTVLGAEGAEVLVLPVDVAGHQKWVLLDAAQTTVKAVQSVDLLRRVAAVTVENLTVPAERVLDVDPIRVKTIAAVLFTAEAVGVAARSTEIASEYAKVREQFGRIIGQFQGVKHKCALMLVETERAAAAVWDAARKLDEPTSSEQEFAAAVAATIAPEAALKVTQQAIQALGGIGFTWEHDAHMYYRRAVGIGAALGKSSAWTRIVTDRALADGLPKAEVALSDDTEARRLEIRAEVAALAELKGKEQTNAMGDGGWVMPHLKAPWGRDADAVDQVLIHQEFKAAGLIRPDMMLAAWMVPSVATYGSSEQQQKYLPRTLRGEIFWCQLFSEPGAGSDLAGLSTKATKVDGGWLINGSKIWNTMAQFAEMGFLLARTDPDAPKHDGITYFLVDMNADGVTVRPLRELTGSALFNQVFFDDVFVPDENVVGEVNRGWKVARNTLSNERVSLSSGEIPLYGTVADLIKWASKTELDALAVDKVGRLIADAYAIRLLNLRSTLLQLDGANPDASSSVSKLLNMKFAQESSEFAHAEFGFDAAIGNESRPAGKWAGWMLASRATTIYGGTTEIQLNIIGERILGLPRDPAPLEK